MFRNIKYGIENLIKWFPVIVRDRDWDYEYMLEIWRFKLSNMKYAAENYWITEDAEKNANEMGECIEIITRIIDNKHEMDAWNKHEETWGKKNPLEPMTEEEREYFFELMDEAETKYDADVSNLMDILSLFNEWWD